MAAQILMILSSVINLALGVMHLVYTFWGSKLTPRDPTLRDSMDNVSPVLTMQTTMWRAWIGFNASHSIGAILFGLVFGYLATAHSQLLFNSAFLIILGLVTLLSYSVLGKVYWFRIPFVGICISLVCFIASIVISWA